MRLGPVAENPIEWLIARLNVAPRPLLETQIAYTLARSIMVGTKLGVFDALSEGAASAAEVAERCGTSVVGTEKLLFALAGAGYVRSEDGSYALTRVSRKWLLRDSPHSVADKMLLQFLEWDWVERSEDYVRTGEPFELHSITAEGEWDLYQRGMRAMASSLAREMVRRLPVPKGAREMLDIGGSHGFRADAGRSWPGRGPSPAILALAAVVLCCGALPSQARAAERSTYYLSLGDSLARGWQPDPSGVGRPGNEGYTDVLLARERARSGGLRAVKLGCQGETTLTMRTGGICAYRRGSQLRAAEAFLRANRGRVAFVTVSIGGNDAQRCVRAGVLAPACAQLALTGLERTLPTIARRLRRAAGAAPVVGVTYYNAFLGLYVQGTSGRARALATVPFANGLNARLRTAYGASRITVADVPRAFSSGELVRTETVAGFGSLPVGVARVCQWTWMCAATPRGPDIHPNRAGYRVIATEIGRVLRRRVTAAEAS